MQDHPGNAPCRSVCRAFWRGAGACGFPVAPRFDFSEFEMAKKQKLTTQYPQHAALLERLCRE
ncbi:hypothetical protein [Mucilaginibacter sp.]|uniref:hypothetical protein n=1 Tax=Mucilaginibacter sp. TaxID=1882438 RepID=UPI00260F8EE3|nr:hypothetical protein [Mucilaginibacter sp.]